MQVPETVPSFNQSLNIGKQSRDPAPRQNVNQRHCSPSAHIPAFEFPKEGTFGAPSLAPPPFGAINSAGRGRAQGDHHHQLNRGSAGHSHHSQPRGSGGAVPGGFHPRGNPGGFPSGGGGGGDFPSGGDGLGGDPNLFSGNFNNPS